MVMFAFSSNPFHSTTFSPRREKLGQASWKKKDGHLVWWWLNRHQRQLWESGSTNFEGVGLFPRPCRVIQGGTSRWGRGANITCSWMHVMHLHLQSPSIPTTPFKPRAFTLWLSPFSSFHSSSGSSFLHFLCVVQITFFSPSPSFQPYPSLH